MSVFLLTCYVCSTKIGEISDISKCFENFVSQTLGVLTRIYAAELRYYCNFYIGAPIRDLPCRLGIDINTSNSTILSGIL